MVQSMPHGMFGKCWDEEVLKTSAGQTVEKSQEDHETGLDFVLKAWFYHGVLVLLSEKELFMIECKFP